MKNFSVFAYGIVLFLAGCSSNNVNNNDSESKDMINTAVESVKMSGNKGRKIKDVENDIKNSEWKANNLSETKPKTEEKLAPKNVAVRVSANNSDPVWHQSPGPMTIEKEAAKAAAKNYAEKDNWAAVAAQSAIKSKRDKEMDDLIRDIEKDKKSSVSE